MSKEIKCTCGDVVAVLSSGSKWKTGTDVKCQKCARRESYNTAEHDFMDGRFEDTALGKFFAGFSSR